MPSLPAFYHISCSTQSEPFASRPGSQPPPPSSTKHKHTQFNLSDELECESERNEEQTVLKCSLWEKNGGCALCCWFVVQTGLHTKARLAVVLL